MWSKSMPSTVLRLSSETTARLPRASDLEVYSGNDTVTIAVTVEAEDGMPTVVFVPLPKDCVAKLISALGDALNREGEQRPES
jgi:hypothetical protein